MRRVVQADAAASMAPACTTDPDHRIPLHFYGLALAGDRIAFAAQLGNSGKSSSMLSRTLAAGNQAVQLAAGTNTRAAGGR